MTAVVKFDTLDHQDVDKLWDPVSRNLFLEDVRAHQGNAMIATKFWIAMNPKTENEYKFP